MLRKGKRLYCWRCYLLLVNPKSVVYYKKKQLLSPIKVVNKKYTMSVLVRINAIVVEKLDRVKKEKGCNSRSDTINLLLELNGNGRVVYNKGKDTSLDRLKPSIKEVKESGNTNDFKVVIAELNNALKKGGNLQKVPFEELEKIKREKQERIDQLKKKFKIVENLTNDGIQR